VFLIGPSVTVVIGIIGVLHWTYFLVVTRTVTMQIRELDYVTAARALGCSRRQVILYDVLPNLANQVIVIFTLEVGVAIIAEASLSFLGVGRAAAGAVVGPHDRRGPQFDVLPAVARGAFPGSCSSRS
jgi:peptide/nickel transport system permease protein